MGTILNRGSAVLILLILRGGLYGACRDCAPAALGGPAENRFTAYDSLCAGESCRTPGVPQVFVNLANLSLYVQVTDLVFGGPAPGLSLDRSFNMDDTRPGPFGVGWSSTLGESLIRDSDGTLLLRRASGRTDRFAAGPSGISAITSTADTIAQNSDGSYTLRTAGSGTTRAFSSGGRLLSIQDNGVTRVSLQYDSAGRLQSALYRGRAIQFAYDSAGRVTSVSDPEGRSVSYSYTGGGRLSAQTNADGQPVAYSYDDSGNLVLIDYAGATIAISYASDPPYLSVASIAAAGATRQYDTPLTPAQVRVTDGNGDATLYVSNALGLLQTVTDALGNSVSYAYDAAGNRVRAVNGAGETYTFTYDSNNNLTGATNPAGNRWRGDYAGGALTRITDPNGNAWSLKYDTAGNLVSVTDPAGGVSTATRSAAGQIAGIADALGNKTSYQYDPDGFLASFADALGGRWRYQYDGAGRPSARTDPGGTTLRADYDATSRINSLATGVASTSFDYSGQRRDALNRLASYTDSFGNQVAYAYDAAGQVASITLPGGKTVTYQYDHAHRLSKVADWAGNFALYRYDAAGSPVSLNISGGPVAVYQYDSARRLRAIVSTGPDGAPVAGYRYTYDAAGNRTGVTALEPAPSSTAPPANQVAFDANNRPVSRGDGQQYRYDVRGNLTAIEGSRSVSLVYDAFGRLQEFDGESSTVYSYDSAGLRVSSAMKGAERRFLYDWSGSRPRVAAEMNGGNTPVAWYVYGLGLLWKVAADGTTYFYHFDGDGNVVAVSNPAKGVVNRYSYDPSGLLVSAKEGVENTFRARGEAGWVDDGNGLLFTGTAYRFPELRMTLPAVADPSPPVPGLLPVFGDAGACFAQGISTCAAAAGRRER